MTCVHACRTLATSRVAASEERVAPEDREALVVVEASVPAEVQAEVGSEDPAL